MSHIENLRNLEEKCSQAGECSGYYAALEQEDQQIDTYTSGTIQDVVTWGTVFVVIGIIYLLAPFVSLFKKIQLFILPKLIGILPILAGVAIGGFIGFSITFGACFKQSCSQEEAAAIWVIPLIGFLLTIPITLLIFRKHQVLKMWVGNWKSWVWITIGLLILAGAVSFMFVNISRTMGYGEQQKEYLRNLDRGY